MPEGISDTIIIIPCFNEEKRLDAPAFLGFLNQYPNIDLMFVNDGSLDQTSQILKSHFGHHQRVSILELDKNQGKAEAVRLATISSLTSGKYHFIGFWDCDLSTPLKESLRMIELLKSNTDLHLVAGSRWNRLGGNVRRSWLRHYPSRTFATLASITINMPVYDTQCGAKIFKTEHLKEVMTPNFLSKWLFDIEIFIRFKNICHREKKNNWGLELPVAEWVEKENSKIKTKDFLIAPYELLRIAIHYNTSK